MKITVDESAIEGLADDPGTRAWLLQVAQYAAERARNRVPVDTGKLRDSISAQATDSGAELVVEVDYALYVEYGTAHESANPYIRPAVDETKRAYGGK